MKAVVYETYGSADVLRIEEIPDPAPRKGWARVEVHATALNPKDVLVRKGKMRWLVGGERQRTPGYDIAGVLLDDADGLTAGTEVFGMIQSNHGGGCAEVVSLPFAQLGAKPNTLSMVEAASLPLAGMTALQALRDELLLQEGQTVLLNGASGGVGTLAVQICRALGGKGIAVCSSRNLSLVQELGAFETIDYTQTSPAERRNLDAVFDIFGSLPWEKARHCLVKGGRYCTAIPKPKAILRGSLRRLGLHRAALVVVKSRRSDLDVLRNLVENEQLRPIVEKVLTMEESAEGHRHIETKRARGKVVIQIKE